MDIQLEEGTHTRSNNHDHLSIKDQWILAFIKLGGAF